MSTLAIGRWQNRYHARVPLDPAQRAQWDDSAFDIDLARELDSLFKPDELVFIRRLHLATTIGHDGSAWQLAGQWRAALLAALTRAIATTVDEQGKENVVGYRCRRDALADMLYRACCRDSSRDWVWVRMALLTPGHHGADTVLLRAVQALQREPAAIWPVLTRLVRSDAQTGALTLLLHQLPSHDLDDLLRVCPQSAPYQMAPASTASVDTVIDVAAPLVAVLLAWRTSHPVLAQTRQRALTVLLAAAAFPAPAPGAVADNLAACARLVQAQDAPRSLLATPRLHLVAGQLVPGKSAARQLPSALHLAGVAPAAERPAPLHEEPPAPPLADAVERNATAYAGLLFLLHLLPAAGLHEHVAAFAPHRLPHVLWHLATHILGIPPRDPAVRAFCGGWHPDGCMVDPHGTLALPGELVAHNLGEYVAQRLPGYTVNTICQRPGTIHLEDGWIEAHLPLDAADTTLRRAGLDLDPGWLPWLGCVVRFVYE